MNDTTIVDRRRFIGGSDIASIMGLQPKGWKTRVQVWERKTAPDPAEEVSPKEQRKRLARGHVVEPLVAKMLEVLHGITTEVRNRRYEDAFSPFFACEIDAELPMTAVAHLFAEGTEYTADDVCNIEIKTVHPFAADEWGEEGTDDIPIHYGTQVQWGMGITGRRFAIAAALFGADDLVLYPMLRDDETIAAMRVRAARFWNDHVLTRIPPEPTDIKDTLRLWPTADGGNVYATDDIRAVLTTLRMIKAAAKSYGDSEEGVALLIREYMKDSARLIDEADNELATLNVRNTTSVDAGLLKEKYPAIYKEVLRKGTTRVLTLKDEK